MGYYDVAQICINGHIINGHYNNYSEHNSEFCSECGKKTIIKCEKCGAKIRGYYNTDFYADLSNLKLPKFCHNCGEMYP